MAGFAILISPDSSPRDLESDFDKFMRLTAGNKQLSILGEKATGVDCIAAKLDSPASIHPGIVRDDQTGSWMLASGTVVALHGDDHPHTNLFNLLRGYIDSGVRVLDAYDGHFGIVIYNGLTKCVSVISDSIGLFSIFYWQQGSRVLISNSALAIASMTESQPDILAVEHFLRTGRLDGDKTLWQGVRRLLGGKVLRATGGRVEITDYWSPTFDTNTARLSFNDAIDQSIELLTQTIKRSLPREGKTWVDLTGGFDSRLVAMLVAKTDLPFSAYCMGPEDHPDVQLSRMIGKEMQWDYMNSQLPERWEPEDDSWFNTALGCGDGRANLLRLAVTMRGFKERSAAIKTNVMGVGGENWRGYCWQIEKGNIGRTTQLNYDALLDNTLLPDIPVKVMRYNRTQEVRQELSTFIHHLCSNYADLPNTAQIDRFEINRDSGHGGAYLSTVPCLVRSIAPLCFKKPVNFAFSLNYRWKYPRYHIFIRALLERESKRLANLDTTTGGPAIPIRVTNIHRFWPLWKDLTSRAVSIGSKKILGKSIHVWPRPTPSEYPLPTWRTAFHAFARAEGLLCFDKMYSQGLYKPNELSAYIERALPDQHNGSEFLDRVISIEMAMRAVGSSIE